MDGYQHAQRSEHNMRGLIRRSRETEAASPEAIRAAREAFGWTQEQVADEMGVLPVEVAAWESGAITVAPYDAAMMRWRMELAVYEAALPRSECYWMRANGERLARMQGVGAHSARRAERERAAHVRECTECLRVQAALRDAAPPPERPLQPGLRGWLDACIRRVERLPAWLRFSLGAAAALLLGGVMYLFVKVLLLLNDPSDGFDGSLLGFMLVSAGFAWFVYLSDRLAPLSDRRPYLAWQLIAAGVVLPGNVVLGLLGHTNPGHAESWALPLIIGVAAGWVCGLGAVDAREKEAVMLDPARVAAAEEAETEREVYVPQRDMSWRG